MDSGAMRQPAARRRPAALRPLGLPPRIGLASGRMREPSPSESSRHAAKEPPLRQARWHYQAGLTLIPSPSSQSPGLPVPSSIHTSSGSAAPERRQRRWPAWPGLLVCLSLLLCARLSNAQQPQGDNETEIARQRFREGVAHYDRQDYEKARMAFLQAYLLKPHPAVLLNLAQSELRAGRHAEAAENLAKYIRQNPTAPAMEHAK